MTHAEHMADVATARAAATRCILTSGLRITADIYLSMARYSLGAARRVRLASGNDTVPTGFKLISRASKTDPRAGETIYAKDYGYKGFPAQSYA